MEESRELISEQDTDLAASMTKDSTCRAMEKGGQSKEHGEEHEENKEKEKEKEKETEKEEEEESLIAKHNKERVRRFN